MVNITKRMHILKPKLLSVRNGPGAAILPQHETQSDSGTRSSRPSQPTLLRIRLDYPPGNGPASKGARAFWRNHLRRLKYYNPALPITVNQNAQKGTEGNPGPAWRLFLDFEGEEKALRELATEPKNEHFKEVMEEELIPRPRSTEEVVVEDNTTQSKPKPRPKSQAKASVTTPPLPPPPSSSSPDQNPPPSPLPSVSTSENARPLISTRTISLPTLNRPAGALWFWFQQRTKCVDVPESDADKRLARELAKHAVKAEEDRKRVKKGIDAMKRQELMLKMARGEVERMRADT
ncbi:hypothetical protein GJ744_010156 [Endocarpon pusillum]|uniref:Ribosomal protein/NADH dehydrogenase domain-containing protein n=1 Tax=Endocarpon pusillum TaxID=364733 RepID=A0A8H7AIP8_9EURO|nr:hypothetical protein GJ744_010156 [Endocarpon pusillum]